MSAPLQFFFRHLFFHVVSFRSLLKSTVWSGHRLHLAVVIFVVNCRFLWADCTAVGNNFYLGQCQDSSVPGTAIHVTFLYICICMCLEKWQHFGVILCAFVCAMRSLERKHMRRYLYTLAVATGGSVYGRLHYDDRLSWLTSLEKARSVSDRCHHRGRHAIS